jgi:hypothetical protein
MAENLTARLIELHDELKLASEEQQEALLDRVEQAVLALEDKGLKVPSWARSALAARIDDAVEDMFDNMPV